VTVTLSDCNSEPLPLALSARPLPADSGPGSNECDGSRAAGWAQAAQWGRSRIKIIKFPKSHTKIKFPKGSETFVHAE
jgi:hypothetical protein